ncbi:MAG TPA: glycosyl transferase [Candidatus Faecousia intestinavium]|nr:glycosyl transferase [Candidatus Faecousia intestinavium]
MSIPKILHYCWFGGKPKPPLAEKCIRSWRKFCPDFGIREWNESNFDLEQVPAYVRQAYEAGRWAFVSDYVRLRALTEVGGVYLDTDVEIVRPLEPFLKHEAFAGFEHLERVQTGVLACRKGFPLFQEFLAYYDTAVFRRPDGSMDTTTNVEILTGICRKKGLVFNDTFQVVDGLAVYPREVFCPVDYDTMKLKKTRKTVTIHWFSGSWQTQEDLRILEEERRWKRQEQRSNLRVAIGSRLFGESGYEKLKTLLRRK